MANQPTHSTTAALPKITIGTRLTDYSTFDLTVVGMASGGMGLVVWGPNAARGGDMNAAKLLRPDLLAAASTPEQRQRLRADFEHEALIWCHLWSHPYLIGTTGLTRLPGWSDLPVLILEYAQQGSLRRWLVEAHQPGKALRWQMALAWAQQIAAALVAIHTPDPEHERPEPLVHCDLKPENVLIMGNGWANLTDLGLTRALAGAAAISVAPESSSPASDFSSSSQQSGQTISQMSTVILSSSSGSPVVGQGTAASSSRDDHEERIARMRAALIAAGALPTTAASERGRRSQRIPALPTVAAIGSRGPVAGTPVYMAPEQWWGLDAVTPATDIYAFGILLFELFAGVPHLLPHDMPPDYLSHDAYFAAWYESHRRGPVRALSAPQVQALSSGPLSALEKEQGEPGAQLATQVLTTLDRLIGACLAPQATLRPSAPEVQRALADLARVLSEAPEEVRDTVKHTPDNEAMFWSNLAITYGCIGEHEEELRLLRRAVALDESNPNNWFNLGAALYELERYDETLAAYAEVERRITPEQWAARGPLVCSLPNNQGAALREMGRYAEAVAAYERSLTFQPNKANAHFNLAIAYLGWVESDLAQAENDQLTAAQLALLTERVRQGQVAAKRAVDLAPNLTQGQQLTQALGAMLARVQRLTPSA